MMRAVSPRDAILVLVGAASMHLFTLLFAPMSERSSIIVNTHLTEHSEHAHVNFHGPADLPDAPLPPDSLSFPHVEFQHPEHPLLSPPPNLLTGHSIPETLLLAHAPGWTIVRNLYMSNGTLFIVTPNPESFPSIEKMTSTGLPAFNTPESIAERMPTEKDMAFLTPAEARKLWIGEEALGEKNRVFKVEGRTLLFNDPNQFLNHYYHFCAELFFGVWAFWTGTFRSFSPTIFPISSFAPVTPNSPSPPLPANAPIYLGESEKIPTWTRAIFAHSTAEEWRDSPGFNAYFLRAAFPSLTVETQTDWQDRVLATRQPAHAAAPGRRPGPSKAWWFDTLLLADRSAAHRGEECGARTQRTASEPLKVVNRTLDKGWWEPVRRAVLRFAGVPQATVAIGPPAPATELDPDSEREVELRKSASGHAAGDIGWDGRIVITYINRQSVRRRLVEEDHEVLVKALEELCARRGWELNNMKAERLSKEEQLAVVARTTFLVGVHGNGLTHLVMMPITPISTVIEIFYPTGFAHDYEWTSRALGIKHYAVWNDTSMSYPDPKLINPNYPEGFQGTQIPVYGPHVAKIIEERADSQRR